MSEVEQNIYGQLAAVQLELKAPKGQRNSFGNYDYRSAEDILEAVKPLLNKHGLTLTVDDSIELVGDRYYVKATAAVFNGAGDVVTATAFAREAEDKKGMDSAQVTGATSSYARKYALNGLFAIDDAKDADTDEHRRQSNTPRNVQLANVDAIRDEHEGQYSTASSSKAASDKQLNLIRLLSDKAGLDRNVTETRIKTIETNQQASEAIEKLNNILASKEEA